MLCCVVLCCVVFCFVYCCSPILTYFPYTLYFYRSRWSKSTKSQFSGQFNGIDFYDDIRVFRMDRTIAPLVNWTDHQSASTRSRFGAGSLVDPTSMRSTLPIASNSTNDAHGIAIPGLASFSTFPTSDNSFGVGVDTDAPLALDCPVFCADPSVDPISIPSNSSDDVGDLSFTASLDRALSLSMVSLYNLLSIRLSYLNFCPVFRKKVEDTRPAYQAKATIHLLPRLMPRTRIGSLVTLV